jgi:DNA-binding GntR family transcriptional regulator
MIAQTLDEHHAILEAICRRDPASLSASATPPDTQTS